MTYRTILHRISLSAGILMPAVLTHSCADNELSVAATSVGEDITLHATVNDAWRPGNSSSRSAEAQSHDDPFSCSENPTTRGTMTNDVGLSFALYAGTFTDAWDESIHSVNYLYNLECKRTANGKYSPEQSHYWPVSKETKVNLFAYAPYNLSNASVTNQSETGSPKLTYTVAPEVKDQQDLLMTSCVANPNEDGLQNLTFSHALTAIKFVAAKDCPEGLIKSISIKGVYSQATSVVGSMEWTGHSNLRDYTLEFSEPVGVGTKETPGISLTSDDNAFIMMPQTMPEGASIEIEFIDIVDIERTFSADISGTTWTPGTIVTYAISPNLLYILDVSEGYGYKPMF